MATQINAKDCDKNQGGTGIIPCPVPFKKPTTLLRVDPSWKFDPATETFNLEYLIAQVQKRLFTPFLQAPDFTNNTPDPTEKEYSDGSKSLIRNGKPEYQFVFENGIAWHKAASSYNGYRSNSLLLVDKSGNVGGMLNVAGDLFTAFLTNKWNTRTYMLETDNDSGQSMLDVQISNEEAFNTRFSVISAETIGADINEELKGIIDVTITPVGAVTAGDPFTVDITALGNTIYGIKALEAANLRIRDTTSNTVIAIDTVAEGDRPGRYVITPDDATTSGHTIVVETYDSTVEVNVARIEDSAQLISGTSASITVAA